MIIDELEERDLQFSLSHHRFLWQQILEISSIDGKTRNFASPSDLISRLQDQLLQFGSEMALISHLFHLDEKNQKEILRTPQAVQAAIACIDLVMLEKRYRHFLELWQQTDPEAEPERYQSYYQAFYAEKSSFKK